MGTAKHGAELKVVGELARNLSLSVGGLPTKFKFRPVVIQGLSMPINLASSFLRFHHWDQLHSQECLRVQGRNIPLVSGRIEGLDAITPLESPLIITRPFQVPPNSQTLLPVHSSDWQPSHTQGVITGSLEFMEKTDLHPGRNVIASFQAGQAVVPVMNTTSEAITIPEGCPFGKVEWLQDASHQVPRPFRIAALQGLPNSPAEEASPEAATEPWKIGPTTAGNKQRRIEFLMQQFDLDQSPFLQETEHLAQALALFLQHWHVFSWDGSFGTCTLLTHEIFTTEGRLINQRIRPINPNLQQQLREQIDEWLAKDVIEPSMSPWNFPLVAVPKKNGKIRWCVDFRQLNDLTEKDAHPIGSVEGNLTSLAGSRIFSALDNAGAFHVVPLSENAKQKTAFSTGYGHWHFKTMPFGLANGPATYSRLVQRVLQGIPTSMALAYLDDILCHSADFKGHMESLTRVFAAYSKAGLKLQPAKCFFFKASTKYLGHIVSADGLSPDPDYVQVVQDWPLPNTRSQVRAFLGKAGYYRKYIANYAAIARPLSDVLQKETFPDLKDKDPFPPSEERTQAFQKLKQALLSKPILAFPDFSTTAKPFVVDTDWSQTNGAIGCCLSQEQDGLERVIAYAAKRLDSTQLNYAPTKGELYAAMFAMKHFEYFLAGKKFILRTDHSSLQYIKSMQPPSLVEGRWLECVTKFDFDVVYRKGTSHGNADALSRAEHLPPALHAVTASSTAQDSDLVALQWWLQRGTPPTPQEGESLDPQIRFFLRYWPHLNLEGSSILLVRPNKPTRRVLSQSEYLEKAKVEHPHLGHKGPAALQRFLDTRFFTYQSRLLCQTVTSSCNQCATKTPPSSTGQRSVLYRTQAGTPWQHLSVDFVGPLPITKSQFKYLLTVKDTFTGYLEAFPTRNMLSSTVAKIFSDQLFSRFGFPESIHTDRGSNFTSSLLQEVCQMFNIRLTHTPPYNQRSNPVERAHRDLKASLTALCAGKPHTWEQHLPTALFAQRIAVSQVTGFSPFYLMFGRQPRCPLDLLDPLPSPHLFESDVVRDMSIPWREALKAARASAARHLCQEQQLYGRPLTTFAEGDLVWLYTPKSKLGSKFDIWWTGPWKILKQTTPVTYTIGDVDSGSDLNESTVAVDRLRAYHPSPEQETFTSSKQELALEEDLLGFEPSPDPPQVPPPSTPDSTRPNSPVSRSPSPPPQSQSALPPMNLPPKPVDEPRASPPPVDNPQASPPPGSPTSPTTPPPEPQSPSPSPPPTPADMDLDDETWSSAPFQAPSTLVHHTPSTTPRMLRRLQPHLHSTENPETGTELSERARRYARRQNK